MGKVIGRVVLNQQDPAYNGKRWLLVCPLLGEDMAAWQTMQTGASPTVVVYDDLGAGIGDLIGFVEGGEASRPFDNPMPIDCYNAAILDRIAYNPSFAN